MGISELSIRSTQYPNCPPGQHGFYKWNMNLKCSTLVIFYVCSYDFALFSKSSLQLIFWLFGLRHFTFLFDARCVFCLFHSVFGLILIICFCLLDLRRSLSWAMILVYKEIHSEHPLGLDFCLAYKLANYSLHSTCNYCRLSSFTYSS